MIDKMYSFKCRTVLDDRSLNVGMGAVYICISNLTIIVILCQQCDKNLKH